MCTVPVPIFNFIQDDSVHKTQHVPVEWNALDALQENTTRQKMQGFGAGLFWGGSGSGNFLSGAGSW